MAVEETAEHKTTEVCLSPLEDSTYKGSTVDSKWDTKSKNRCYSYNHTCNSNQSYLSTGTKLIVIVLAAKKKFQLSGKNWHEKCRTMILQRLRSSTGLSREFQETEAKEELVSQAGIQRKDWIPRMKQSTFFKAGFKTRVRDTVND